jgi:two-component sensor histidine kinase
MVPVNLDMDRLMTLSLLVTEVVTNSLKHAFPGRDDGKIQLSLRPAAAGQLELTIRDNGCGLPTTQDPKARKGLGTLIVKGLAAQLQGTLHVDGSDGVTTRLLFPAQ